VPAAAVAGRILASQGNTARVTKLLAQVWRASPHPEIALIYAHARTGDSPRDRLARVKALAESAPAGLEGDIAVAVAAMEAMEWDAARAALQAHLASNPPARVCRLMARIEAGQNRDLGRAREWLAKAARGAPDPVWVAPDGTVSTEWHAVAPRSGALGAFEWKTPPAMPAAVPGDGLAGLSELDAPVAGAGPFPEREPAAGGRKSSLPQR
jgi:HemY protein